MWNGLWGGARLSDLRTYYDVANELQSLNHNEKNKIKFVSYIAIIKELEDSLLDPDLAYGPLVERLWLLYGLIH